jgi:hypothetical protein
MYIVAAQQDNKIENNYCQVKHTGKPMRNFYKHGHPGMPVPERPHQFNR